MDWVVPMVVVLPPATICAAAPKYSAVVGDDERGVGAVPQRDVVGAQYAVDGVGQVFGLQIGELRLLLAELHVEQVVVDLRDQRLQRHDCSRRAWARPAGATMLRGSTKPEVAEGDGIAVSSK